MHMPYEYYGKYRPIRARGVWSRIDNRRVLK